MAANNSPIVRVFQLMTSVADLVLRGKRDPDQVAEVFQLIKDNPDFAVQLLAKAEDWEMAHRCVAFQLQDWENFYREVFGISRDFFKLRVPPHKAGFDRLIVVAKGMNSDRIFKRMSELMPAFKPWKKCDELDCLQLIISERQADFEDYAIWIRNRVEADKELKEKSADDLIEKGIPAITLEEHLLYEIKYWKETGKNLDERNFTLCSGSRVPGKPCLGDFVPYVKRCAGGVTVDLISAGRRGEDMRSREVVF